MTLARLGHTGKGTQVGGGRVAMGEPSGKHLFTTMNQELFKWICMLYIIQAEI